MKTTRTGLLSFCALLCSFTAISQMNQAKMTHPGASLRHGLEKVLDDYPRQFTSIKGAVISENPQSTDFTCLVGVEGAEECSITQYSGAKPVFTWQAVMLTTEDYEEAARRYRALYQQLKGMPVTMNFDYAYRLTGAYEAPDESRKFTTSTFVLLPSATNLPRVKVELSLHFYFPEWKVQLTVFEKERNDEEQGDTEEY